MNVIRTEQVELSTSEEKAFDTLFKLCEDIQYQCQNPTLINLAEDAEFTLRNLYYTAIDNVEI